MFVSGTRASTALAPVQRAQTYVAVQPVPPVGVEREPRTFGPLHGTPATLTVADLLAVRPRTRFAPPDAGGPEVRVRSGTKTDPSGNA